MRYAIVRDDSIDRVARYLPSNYKVIRRVEEGVLIQGSDLAGWTLDGYVIPRLASGLIAAREVTLGEAHPKFVWTDPPREA